MMSSADIRKKFLDFFASRQHTVVASSPIVVKNDPTLLFTNAGMNQFKDYFLGNRPAPHARVADTQKCLRVSGKHNDLEEVGVDTYHHTMFEMLGNWSFGDPDCPEVGYFKKEAIAWSWELLTEVYGISKDRLYVTVFEGDAKEGLPKDDDAYNYWKQHIAADRILLGNKKDNFWEMGDTGPCGPCTEIHVDCRTDDERAKVAGETLVNKDHPQVIEIWNNVFMQFNRMKDGSLVPLPAKHVDTGMGLERLVRVLQGKQSNYDTDLFTGTIAAVAQISGRQYGFTDSKADIAFRVIADHIRAICFTIADGQLPSNNGAGYVIRRILRRAVRYYYSYLLYKQPLLFQLVPLLADQFAEVFPELKAQVAFVQKVVREEEEAFLRTLEKGLRRMDDLIATAAAKDGKIVGSDAFELFDTYGFPLDLTRLIASEHQLSIDEAGFELAMQQQKNRSRAATAIDTGDWVLVHEAEGEGFVGYHQQEIQTQVLRYRKVKAKGAEQFQLVLASTPFYAESGGQAGDTGTLDFNGEQISITDTKKENDLIIHFTDKLPAQIDAPVKAQVNGEKRLHTAYNHTATHLMHAALRQVLGNHVAQKGSLVNENYLRFDFSHFAKMTDEEIRKVEQLVNEKIRANIPVVIKEMPKEEALKLGAMALFGEKYGDVVRVVIIDPNYSVELCGGTHVAATGDIGLFVVQAETAVAAGVRRVEALTGAAAFNHLMEQQQQLQSIAQLLKAKEPQKAVEKMLQEKVQLEKKLEQLEAAQIAVMQQELLKSCVKVNDFHFVGTLLQLDSADALKQLCYQLRQHCDVVVLASAINGKAAVAIGISDKASAQFDAGKLIKELVSPLIQGGGGGQKTLATAGGQQVAELGAVISKIKEHVASV